MIQDIHSHTYYSFCGKDTPDTVVQTAIAGGIEVLGICDHQYGVAGYRPGNEYPDQAAFLQDYTTRLRGYLDHIRLVAERYRDQIRVVCGIEIATRNQPHWVLPDGVDISGFDYCLIEHLDLPDTAVKDLFSFAERCGCRRVGIAHTDMFAFLETRGEDTAAFFRRMAEQNIFWEMNVSYDSIHCYREHEYVKRFFRDPAQQEIIRASGVKLSVGFDGHRVEDYRPDRVADACRRLEELALPLADI